MEDKSFTERFPGNRFTEIRASAIVTTMDP